jgi:hypothetical protein
VSSQRQRRAWAFKGVAGLLAIVAFLAGSSHADARIWECPWTTGTVDRISCAYGCGRHQGTAYFGLDFNWYGKDGTGGANSDCGRFVLSTDTGQVRRSACSGKKADSGYGCHVEVLHDTNSRGPRSFYAHLRQQPPVARGQWVCKGQLLGLVGRSGSGGGSTCHLHFHMRTNGGRDPLPPEPMWGARAPGTTCAGHLGLHADDELRSCIEFGCLPPGAR